MFLCKAVCENHSLARAPGTGDLPVIPVCLHQDKENVCEGDFPSIPVCLHQEKENVCEGDLPTMPMCLNQDKENVCECDFPILFPCVSIGGAHLYEQKHAHAPTLARTRFWPSGLRLDCPMWFLISSIQPHVELKKHL